MNHNEDHATVSDCMSANQKAIIYCRVSSTKQTTEGTGLQSQELRCRRYAADKGYSVTAVFPDDVSGGGDYMKRPGMVALLAFLDAHPDEEFVVIFDDLKRFARDTVFHLQLRQALNARGAKVECLNFKFEDTPEGQFIETILAAQGELERQQNRRQTVQKMRARVEQGYWLFNPPIGYCFGKGPDGGKMLTPDEPNASIVREALEGYASGRFVSATDVNRFLERHPSLVYERKSAFRRQFAIDLLRRPLYAGYMTVEKWNLHMHPCKHESLISLETWQRIQDRLDGRAHKPARPTVHEDFPMRHFVSCSCCDTPMTSAWSKGRSKLYGYYVCQQKGCERRGKSIRKERIEGDFAALARELTPAPQLLTAAKAMFSKIWTARYESEKEQRKALAESTASIDGKISKLIDRIMNSNSARVIAAYEKEVEALEAQKRLMADKAAQPLEPVKSFETAFRAAMQFLAMPWKLWESGEYHQQRLLLKLAVPKAMPYCPENGFSNREFSLPFNILGGINMLDNKMVPAEGTKMDSRSVT